MWGSELGFVAFVVVALLVMAMWRVRIRTRYDTSWLPWDLRHAELAYGEKMFRGTQPFPLVAKVDRGYRTTAGVIVLVELKTRDVNRAYFSDIIELSAQRVAVQSQTGESVACYGYVLIQRRQGGRKVPHRVSLLPVEEVVALAQRREAIRSGQAMPQFATNQELCKQCVFQQKCRKG
jgi:CRISPR-associated exonuclease Cas4